MLTKRIIAIFLLASAAALSAQGIKRMTDNEFQYYEYLLRTGQANNYRKPDMDKDVWRNFLNDLISQVIEAKVPKSVNAWREKKDSQVPSRNKIRLLAFRLRRLTDNPELEEVSGQKLQWFKNIGNLFIELENYQNLMIRAVERGRNDDYLILCQKYKTYTEKLKKLLDDRDEWKLSRKELNAIQKKNSAVRKKKYDELEMRYKYTRKLKDEEEQRQTKENRNRKIQERDNRRGARR